MHENEVFIGSNECIENIIKQWLLEWESKGTNWDCIAADCLSVFGNKFYNPKYSLNESESNDREASKNRKRSFQSFAGGSDQVELNRRECVEKNQGAEKSAEKNNSVTKQGQKDLLTLGEFSVLCEKICNVLSLNYNSQQSGSSDWLYSIVDEYLRTGGKKRRKSKNMKPAVYPEESSENKDIGCTKKEYYTATSLLIAKCCVLNVRYFEELVSALSKNEKTFFLINESLLDLCIHHLLPPSRPLFFVLHKPHYIVKPVVEYVSIQSKKKFCTKKNVFEWDLSTINHTVAQLLFFWGFENLVKFSFGRYVQALSTFLVSNLRQVRLASAKTLFQLCLHRQEQAECIIKILIDKLNDIHTSKMQSNIVFYIQNIVSGPLDKCNSYRSNRFSVVKLCLEKKLSIVVNFVLDFTYKKLASGFSVYNDLSKVKAEEKKLRESQESLKFGSFKFLRKKIRELRRVDVARRNSILAETFRIIVWAFKILAFISVHLKNNEQLVQKVFLLYIDIFTDLMRPVSLTNLVGKKNKLQPKTSSNPSEASDSKKSKISLLSVLQENQIICCNRLLSGIFTGLTKYFDVLSKFLKKGASLAVEPNSLLESDANNCFPQINQSFKDVDKCDCIDRSSKILKNVFQLSYTFPSLKIRILILDFIHSLWASGFFETIKTRFLRSLYFNLADPNCFNASNRLVLFGIVSKVVCDDPNCPIVSRMAYLKRMCQSAPHCSSYGALCGPAQIIEFILNKKFFRDSLSMSEKKLSLKKFKDDTDEIKKNPDDIFFNCYCPSKRDPVFSNARRAAFWELAAFSAHFHPMVSVLGKELIKGQLDTVDNIKKMSPDMLGRIMWLIDNLSSNSFFSILANKVCKKERLRKHKSNKNKDRLDDGNNETDTGSNFVWTTKSIIFPHEIFMHKYYTDPYVVEKMQKMKSSDDLDNLDVDPFSEGTVFADEESEGDLSDEALSDYQDNDDDLGCFVDVEDDESDDSLSS